jgi:hypothetical protein
VKSSGGSCKKKQKLFAKEGQRKCHQSAELQKYYDIREELERMRSKSEAAENELAEIGNSDKSLVPDKAGAADDGERERMRLLMRAEKLQCCTLSPSSSCFRFTPISHAMQI